MTAVYCRAAAQETRGGRLYAPDDDDDSEVDRNDPEEDCDRSEASMKEEDMDPPNPGVTINGEAVWSHKKHSRIAYFKGHKTRNKHEQTAYDSERQAKFLKSAQKFVLSKGNKLKVFSNYKKKLDHLRSLGLQLKLLKEHLIDHELYDVFTIVFPMDVTAGPEIHKGLCDLFPD